MKQTGCPDRPPQGPDSPQRVEHSKVVGKVLWGLWGENDLITLLWVTPSDVEAGSGSRRGGQCGRVRAGVEVRKGRQAWESS